MSRKKHAYELYTWESTNPKHDTTGNVAETMLNNPAYKSLTKNQRLLYMYLKAQRFGKRKPLQDFPEVVAYRTEACFYFSLGQAIEYELYTESNKGQYYADMAALEEKGFIRRLSKGQKGRSRSIYLFINEWWTDDDRKRQSERVRLGGKGGY